MVLKCRDHSTYISAYIKYTLLHCMLHQHEPPFRKINFAGSSPHLTGNTRVFSLWGVKTCAAEVRSYRSHSTSCSSRAREALSLSPRRVPWAYVIWNMRVGGSRSWGNSIWHVRSGRAVLWRSGGFLTEMACKREIEIFKT